MKNTFKKGGMIWNIPVFIELKKQARTCPWAGCHGNRGGLLLPRESGQPRANGDRNDGFHDKGNYSTTVPIKTYKKANNS